MSRSSLTALAFIALAITPASSALRAGAAVTDITPELGVSLDGLLQKFGPIKEVLDPLSARCLVLDDGKTRLAIVLIDACIISGEVVERAKRAAGARTGLAANRILVSATHTHMAPRIAGWTDAEIDRRYYDLVVERIADAVEKSIERLAPAEMGWAAVPLPEYLANRRWIMKPGTVGPDPFGDKGDGAVMGGQPAKSRLKPAGPVDPAFTLISLRHSGGCPLAFFANYGIHYGTNKRGAASSDYFGHFARALESEFNTGQAGDHPPVVALISNGASADVNSRGGGLDRMHQFGDALAAEALRLCAEIEHRTDVTIGMREARIELAVRKPDENRIAWARETLAASPGTTPHRWTRIFAEEALHLAEFPETVSVPLQALRLGDLGLVAIPGEVFAATGLALRAESPLKTTLTISHANAWHGYIPPPDQHALGGMEVWPRRASYLETGASLLIREKLGELLRSMSSSETPETRPKSINQVQP